MRVDEQKSDVRRIGWTSKLCIAKSISVKSRGRRSGDCAWKAAGITTGDLSLLRIPTGKPTNGAVRDRPGDGRAVFESRPHAAISQHAASRLDGSLGDP